MLDEMLRVHDEVKVRILTDARKRFVAVELAPGSASFGGSASHMQDTSWICAPTPNPQNQSGLGEAASRAIHVDENRRNECLPLLSDTPETTLRR